MQKLKRNRLVLLLVITVFIFSCDNETSTNEGLIVDEVSFGDCNGFYKNENGGADFSKKIAIYSNAEYQEFLKQINLDTTNCKSIPKINFNEYTLIGQGICFQGCEVAFKRSFKLNSNQTKAIYTIEKISIGDCQSTTCSMNYVLIKKLNPEIPITYEIK